VTFEPYAALVTGVEDRLQTQATPLLALQVPADVLDEIAGGVEIPPAAQATSARFHARHQHL